MVSDAKANFTTRSFLPKMEAQRRDLIRRFPKSMLWHTDGGWFAPDEYWGNLDWLTYLYEESPLKERIVTCNSMGFGCCKTYPGSSKCWEYGDAPSGGDRTTAGSVVPHFYTNQMTIEQGSWGWDRSEGLSQMLGTVDLVRELTQVRAPTLASVPRFASWSVTSLGSLAQTTAWNGTLIVNVGPTADGRLAPIFEERLGELGAWLSSNGAAIFGTRPWAGALPSGGEAGGGKEVYYTCKGGTVFAITLAWPDTGVLNLELPVPGAGATAKLLATGATIAWTGGPAGRGMGLKLGAAPPLGSRWAWAIQLDGLS